MRTVRTFIAVKLPESILDEITRVQGALRTAPGGRAVTWVRPEGIHLTLKFLGDTPEELLPAIYERVEHVGTINKPFNLTVAGIGCFPRINRPRVIWVGLKDEHRSSQRLQRDIDQQMAYLHFPLETRPFQAHLTLGRVRSSALTSEIEMIARTLSSTNVGELGILPVDHLCVIASTLTPSGAVYQTLYRCRLG